MDIHAEAISSLRAHRGELRAHLRALGFAQIRVPRDDHSAVLRLVVFPDEHVDLGDLYDAEVLVADIAGEPVDLVSVRTPRGQMLAQDADDL